MDYGRLWRSNIFLTKFYVLTKIFEVFKPFLKNRLCVTTLAWGLEIAKQEESAKKAGLSM